MATASGDAPNPVRYHAVMPYLERARDRAARVLGRHWTAVQALAGELVRRRELSGDEVRRLVQPLMSS